MTIQWHCAMEHLIPKTKPPCHSNIKDFCPIAFLNVDRGKLFFGSISKRPVSHILTYNNPINTSVQKGSMGQVSGCWEHRSVVWSASEEAHSKRSSLANIWLDIANAYWSIPHRLLFFCVRKLWPWLPLIPLIKRYYSGIYSCSFSHSAPSSWHQHFKGTFAECTLSFFFLAGINVVIEYTLASLARKFVSTGNVALPLVGAFMNDLNLMSSSVSGMQNLSDRCVKALLWAGMYYYEG